LFASVPIYEAIELYSLILSIIRASKVSGLNTSVSYLLLDPDSELLYPKYWSISSQKSSKYCLQ